MMGNETGLEYTDYDSCNKMKDLEVFFSPLSCLGHMQFFIQFLKYFEPVFDFTFEICHCKQARKSNRSVV